MDQFKGLTNNCFVRNWLTVYYLASIVGLVGLGVQCSLKCPLSALVHISPGVPSIQ